MKNNLEQRVNERSRAGASQDHHQPQQEQEYEYRCQPPLFVVPEKIPELRNKAAGPSFSLFLETR